MDELWFLVVIMELVWWWLVFNLIDDVRDDFKAWRLEAWAH